MICDLPAHAVEGILAHCSVETRCILCAVCRDLRLRALPAAPRQGANAAADNVPVSCGDPARNAPVAGPHEQGSGSQRAGSRGAHTTARQPRPERPPPQPAPPPPAPDDGRWVFMFPRRQEALALALLAALDLEVMHKGFGFHRAAAARSDRLGACRERAGSRQAAGRHPSRRLWC